jgi:uncharacterized protein involved in oxidation of intracellular sulfur
VKVKLCVSCAEARGITEDEIVDGAEIGVMKELIEWIERSDKVMVF